MKHYLWIIGLLVLAFVGDRFGGWICTQLVENSGFRYSRLYTDRAEADILLVGNSRGLTFYQPAIEAQTGKSTLNLSYNALPMDLAQVFINDYLADYPAPQKAIIDITLLDRTNAPLIASCTPYLSFSENMRTLINAEQPKSYNGAQVSHLYRFNSELFQRSLFYNGKENDETWLLDRVINSRMLADTTKLEPYSMTLEPEMLADLVTTVTALQQQGTKIKLTVNPYLPAFAKSITNLDSVILAVQKATNLPINDYSRSYHDPNLFGDYQHLNKAGSEQFIKQLKRDGVL